jgi:hypothetical protein
MDMSAEKTEEMYEAMSDTVAAFLDTECEIMHVAEEDDYGTVSVYLIEVKALHRYYQDWCRKKKLVYLKLQQFKRRLSKMRDQGIFVQNPDSIRRDCVYNIRCPGMVSLKMEGSHVQSRQHRR